MSGKCPKCERLISRVNVTEVDGTVFMGRTWRTVTYDCPFCNSILGCQIDPIAVKTDTVNEILEALKR